MDHTLKMAFEKISYDDERIADAFGISYWVEVTPNCSCGWEGDPEDNNRDARDQFAGHIEDVEEYALCASAAE